MFDTNPDDEPSLDELFETDDPDSLDQHETTGSDSDDSTDSDNSEPDWAKSIIDDTDSEPDSESTTTTDTSDTTESTHSPSLVTSASGTAHESSDNSLVVSKSSLPTLPSSLDSPDPAPEWLSRMLSGVQYTIRKIFFAIMAPVIFLLVFVATFVGYFIPMYIALMSVFGTIALWFFNPFQLGTGGLLAWTAVLTGIFFGALYAWDRLDEIYSDSSQE